MGDAAARTGIALEPGVVAADHIAGGNGVEIGLLARIDAVLRNEHDALNALQRFDLVHLAVGQVNGHGVGGQRQVPVNVQRLAGQHVRRDLCGQRRLLGFERLGGCHGGSIAGRCRG